MERKWSHLLQTQAEIGTSPDFLFTGGACNVLTPQGNIRNVNRDPLLDWLNARRAYFFDPQIHPDTHGMNYNYDVHGPAEVAAREYARALLYEINPFTHGTVTLQEATRDCTLGRPVVLWFTGGPEAFDDRKRPIFTPLTLQSVDAVAAANAGRKNLFTWFQNSPNVAFCYELAEVKEALQEMAPELF